jgi:hypothetical protein
MEGRPAELATTLSCLGGAERRGITLKIVLVGPTEPDFELPEAARWFAADGSHAAQLAAGARTARGEWLLFLVPGMHLDRGWDASVMVFASSERNRERGAVFTHALAHASAESAALEKSIRFRNNWLGLPEAEQGLVINRRFYRHLQGHREPDVLAHADLLRRIGMVRMVRLDVRAVIENELIEARVRATRTKLRLLLFTLRLPVRWIAKLLP